MKMYDPKIWRLCLVTDRPLAKGRPLVEIVEAAVRGGVTMVQLREKDCTTRDFLTEARALKDLLTPLGVPLIINDRVDIALAVDAAVRVGGVLRSRGHRDPVCQAWPAGSQKD